MHGATGQLDEGSNGVGRALDLSPLTYLHILIVFASGLGLIFDTLEASMTNVLATVFAHRPGVERADLTILLVSVFAGGAIGAPLAGRIADRIGRRTTLLIALVGYALSSIAAAFATNLTELAILRFIGGLFLASYPPLMWTYLADTLPPGVRGRWMMICGAAGSLGSTLAPILSRNLDGWLGFEGWQTAFAVGGVGGLAVALLTLTLPESPRWLERRGRLPAAQAALGRFLRSRPISRAGSVAAPAPVSVTATARAGDVDRGPHFRARLTLLLVLQFLQPLGVIGFAALSGVVLAQKGHDVHSSLLYVAVAGLGAPVGAILASVVIDRFPRHLTFSVCGIGMAVLGIAFGLSESPAAAMLIGASYMIVLVIYSMTLSIYGPEMFITEVRGFAAGAGYSANRVGAAMVPLVLLPLLLATNPTVMFGLIAATLLLSVVLVLRFGPRGVAGHALR